MAALIKSKVAKNLLGNRDGHISIMISELSFCLQYCKTSFDLSLMYKNELILTMIRTYLNQYKKRSVKPRIKTDFSNNLFMI